MPKNKTKKKSTTEAKTNNKEEQFKKLAKEIGFHSAYNLFEDAMGESEIGKLSEEFFELAKRLGAIYDQFYEKHPIKHYAQSNAYNALPYNLIELIEEMHDK